MTRLLRNLSFAHIILSLLWACYKGDTLVVSIPVPFVEANDTLQITYARVLYDTSSVRTDRDLTPIVANWYDQYRGSFKSIFHFELQPVSESAPTWSSVDSAFLTIVPDVEFGANKTCYAVRLLRTEGVPTPFYSNTKVQTSDSRITQMCKDGAVWKITFPIAWSQELLDAQSLGIIKSVSEFRQHFGGLALEILDTNIALEIGIGLLNSSMLTMYWKKDTINGKNEWVIPIDGNYGSQYETSFIGSKLEQWIQNPEDSLIYLSPQGSVVMVRLPEVPDSIVILGAWLSVTVADNPMLPEQLTVVGYDTLEKKTYPLIESLNDGIELASAKIVSNDTAKYLIPIPLTIQYHQKGTLKSPFVIIKNPKQEGSFSRILLTPSNLKVYLYIEKMQ